jgi:hypothetical protein
LATNYLWNPERVPHLRRSLRQAKLGFVRVGGIPPRRPPSNTTSEKNNWRNTTFFVRFAVYKVENKVL